jgi:hypothetical protein
MTRTDTNSIVRTHAFVPVGGIDRCGICLAAADHPAHVAATPTPDDEHPVRWSAAGGGGPDAYLSVEDAVDRLVSYGWHPAAARRDLLAGRTVRTPFAFYTMDVPDAPAGAGDEIEAYRG